MGFRPKLLLSIRKVPFYTWTRPSPCEREYTTLRCQFVCPVLQMYLQISSSEFTILQISKSVILLIYQWVCCMQLELSAKRERVEEEVKCSRQQKMERTMQMSAIAAINQNLARVRTGNNWWIQVGCGGLPPRWFELVGNPQVSLQRCCAGEAIWRNLNVRKTLRSQSLKAVPTLGLSCVKLRLFRSRWACSPCLDYLTKILGLPMY